MMFTDTHTHLYDEKFEDGGVPAVRAAIEAGVTKMILPGTHPGEFAAMERLADAFPDNIFLAYGLHPTEFPDDVESALKVVRERLERGDKRIVAVGEIGIDLYWEQDKRELQMEVFRRQCELAVQHKLPVIIHCREGLDETLEVLGSLEKAPRGVFHCFCGTPEDARRIREVGDFYFGIGGVLTFKNSKLAESLPEIGIDRILLETDSPYLAPVPHRGKRNESAYIPLIATKVAEVMGLSPEMVGEITTQSAHKLFGI